MKSLIEYRLALLEGVDSFEACVEVDGLMEALEIYEYMLGE